jgi:hypothetical protein
VRKRYLTGVPASPPPIKPAILDSIDFVNPDQQKNNKPVTFLEKSKSRQPNVFTEFGDFLIHNKKWWLTPIFFILLLFSLFIALTGTAIGPFIYAFF